MIDKGIPIPRLGRPRTTAGEEGRQMKPGDSRLCDSESEASTVKSAIRLSGGKAAIRKVEGGWRVWRKA
jgi:hypothetical protein